MNSQDLQSKLSVDQRATVAKVAMVSYEAFENCKSEQEIAIFFNYLMNKLQQQALNRLLSVTGSYVEIVKEEGEDAIQSTEPA